MTESELQAIEERWNNKNMCVHSEALKEINRLLAEVRRLNRMLNVASVTLSNENDWQKWRKYLESEVQHD